MVSVSTRAILFNLALFAGFKAITWAHNAANDQEVRLFELSDLTWLLPVAGIFKWAARVSKISLLPTKAVAKQGVRLVGNLYKQGLHTQMVKAFNRVFARNNGRFVRYVGTKNAKQSGEIIMRGGQSQRSFKHLITRHVVDYWDGSLKKGWNTMWPVGTTASDVLRHLRQAVIQLDSKLALKAGQKASRKVVLSNGITARVAVKNIGGKVWITSFYPLKGPGVFDARHLIKHWKKPNP